VGRFRGRNGPVDRRVGVVVEGDEEEEGGIYTHICIYICLIYVCIYKCVCIFDICICMYIHIYIYVYIYNPLIRSEGRGDGGRGFSSMADRATPEGQSSEKIGDVVEGRKHLKLTPRMAKGIYIYMYIYIYVYAFEGMYMYVYKFIYIYLYICIYSYVYIYIYRCHRRKDKENSW
jgi:hypothetical protein